MFLQTVARFFILAVILITLERLFFARQQPIFREGWMTDVVHLFVGNLIGRASLFLMIGILSKNICGDAVNFSWQSQVAAQPIGLQLIEILFVAELGYYTAHRLAHQVPWLWKFHAVHHSAKNVDWLATVRVHPGEQILTRIFQFSPILILGFSEQVVGIFLIFSAFEAFFIHSNLKISLPGLRWIIATPELHRWHHNKNPKFRHKNYAAQLPIIDLIFGTLYMPGKRLPTNYGVPEKIPVNYLGQLMYPFRRQLPHKVVAE
jgi:sterol desaturase/sphingolipid hydroxylase (fatty acid hydroxylase superfamily)